MTTSDSREMIEAKAEEASRAAFRDLGSNTTATEVRAYIKGWMAASALFAQAPSVAVGELEALISSDAANAIDYMMDVDVIEVSAIRNLISKAGCDE